MIQRGSGTFLTTAGHVFDNAMYGEFATVRNSGTPVSASAVLVEIQRTARVDCALLNTGVPAQNLYMDRHQVSGVYMPDPLRDVGRSLWVCKASGRKAVKCRGLHGAFTLPDGALIERAILTDYATDPGDSGCPLVDGDGRVWGLLRGGLLSRTAPVSIFATALDLLVQLQAQLS